MKTCLVTNLFKLSIADDRECTLMIIARVLANIRGYPGRHTRTSEYMIMRGQIAVSLAGAMLAVGGVSGAASAEDIQQLDTIVVTATRIAQSSIDLPVWIDRVDRRTIRDGQLQVNCRNR